MANIRNIAKNTIALYLRMFVIMLASLYIVRILLHTMGVDNFGIFTAVSGIVMLFNFFCSSMIAATQRYFSFALGKKDLELLLRIFNTNVLVYLAVALLAVLLLETMGAWFVAKKLVIQPEQKEMVQRLFHFSVFALVGNLCTSPFIAILIAHEDLQIYAGISAFECLLKIIAALSLSYVSYNVLAIYGFFLLIISLITLGVYAAVCFLKYKECRFRLKVFDLCLLKEIFSFTGWTIFGSMTCAVRSHAVTILLNQYFSPVTVAARAIALNVSGALNQFSGSFNMSLYAPIVKCYAEDKKQELFLLICNGAKITFFLMWLMFIPLYLKMEYILYLWLKVVPEEVALFSRLSIVEVMIAAISLPLAAAARAPGKIKMYEFVLGTIQFLIFPAAWIAVSSGIASYCVFIIAIIANVLMFFVRLVFIHVLLDFPLKMFFLKSVAPCLAVVVSSFPLLQFLGRILPDTFVWFCFFLCSTGSIVSVAMLLLGFNKSDRNRILYMLKNSVLRKKLA